MDLTGKQVLVAGLGKSGIAAGALLKKMGCMVCLFDGNEKFDRSAWEKTYPVFSDCPLWIGELPDAAVQEMELAVVSPGIPLDTPAILKLQAAGVPVVGEAELAYRFEKGRVAAITGTNGKTTTTTMIADVLNHGGKSGVLSGNIGFPASEVAQSVTAQDNLVMELSSFQLMGIEAFHPEIAVITNLMPTHIDYHGSFENYVAAKWNLQKNMTEKDVIVLNFNQDLAKELATKTKASVLPFSTVEKVDGAYLEDGLLKFKGEVVMRADELGVPGSHNVENALATIAVAKVRGVENEVIKETLSAFGGVKHRLQYVDEIQGVKFYNDSKSTNILATQKALSGFDNSKVILIAGGLDRGNEFDELVPHITGLKEMVILGESAPRVKRAADKAGVSYVDAADVADATKKAFDLASPGDVVLLSPANASWDMYPNFEVRGDEFLATVKGLK